VTNKLSVNPERLMGGCVEFAFIEENIMSAPDTNLDKQSKRHKGPLLGFAAALLWAAILLVGFLIWTADKSDEPSALDDAAMGTVGNAEAPEGEAFAVSEDDNLITIDEEAVTSAAGVQPVED
jgi:cytoskeletal protein RodZ